MLGNVLATLEKVLERHLVLLPSVGEDKVLVNLSVREFSKSQYLRIK
jgi:hypothetical protein